MISEAYVEPCQTSKMQRFTKIVNAISYFRTKRSFLDF